MENTERNLRAEAGLQEGKPTILVCSDSAALPTGLSRVVRSVFGPIQERGNLQVVQHGWYHLEGATHRDLPFRIIPVKRMAGSPVNFDPSDKVGQLSFDAVVEAIKPDIVFTVTDYDRIGHMLNSVHRSSYAMVAYLPLDNFPPAPLWAERVKGPDRIVYYTDFAQTWGQAVGAPGPSIPHGVNTSTFAVAPPELRQAMRKRLFQVEDDDILIGAAGRNLPRKQFPLLIEAFSALRHGAYGLCQMCGQYSVFDFVLPDQEYQQPDKCPVCQQLTLVPGKAWDNIRLNLHTDLEETALIPIQSLVSFWKVEDATYLNRTLRMAKGDGLPDSQLANVYQCLDVFVHPASGGGWELPPLEAAACGVPLVAVNAPAHGEWIGRLPGSVVVEGAQRWDSLSSGYRVYASPAQLLKGMLHYLENPEARRLGGAANADHVKEHYDWETISLEWERIFLELMNPETRIAGWRVLREV